MTLFQSFNRFILHQIEMESGKMEEDGQEKVDPVTKLFAMKQQNLNRCTRCGREETKQSTVFLSNILYSPDCKYSFLLLTIIASICV